MERRRGEEESRRRGLGTGGAISNGREWGRVVGDGRMGVGQREESSARKGRGRGQGRCLGGRKADGGALGDRGGGVAANKTSEGVVEESN